MSWSTSFVKAVPKHETAAAIAALSITQVDGPMMDQCELAKRAAALLLPIIPGPYIYVSLSGHANGIGWHEKTGWADDCITVNVSQRTEE